MQYLREKWSLPVQMSKEMKTQSYTKSQRAQKQPLTKLNRLRYDCGCVDQY